MELHSITEKQFLDLQEELAEGEEIDSLTDLFKALCDPTRLRILFALRGTELCVHDLAALVESSESNTSHQLRILREMRLVKNHRKGKQVFYSIDDDHVTRIIDDVRSHLNEE